MKIKQSSSMLIHKLSVSQIAADVILVVFIFTFILLLSFDIHAQTVDEGNFENTTISTGVKRLVDTASKPENKATSLLSPKDGLKKLGSEAIDKLLPRKKYSIEMQEANESSEPTEVEFNPTTSKETKPKIVPEGALETETPENKQTESVAKPASNSEEKNHSEQSTQVESTKSNNPKPTRNNVTQSEAVEPNTNTLSEVTFATVEDFMALTSDVEYLSKRVLDFKDDIEGLTLQMSTLRQDMQQVKGLVIAIQSQKDIQTQELPSIPSKVSELESVKDRINRIEQRLALAESRIAGVGTLPSSPVIVQNKPSDEVPPEQKSTQSVTNLSVLNEKRLKLITGNKGESALFTLRVAKNKYQRYLLDSKRCSEIGNWVLQGTVLLQKTSIILSKDGRLGICKLLRTGEWRFFTGVSGNDRGHIVLGGEE